MKVIRVALDVPLSRLFDYRCDDVGDGDVGRRVLVPFGRRNLVGIILGLAAESDIAPGKLRAAVRVLRDTPALPPEWISLAEFCAHYYQRPIGEVVTAALPPRLRRPEPLAPERPVWALTDAGQRALALPPGRAKRERALLEALSGGAKRADDIEPPPASAVCAALVEKGWIAAREHASAPLGERAAFVSSHTLTDDQAAALSRLEQGLGSFGVHLLFGITGSGKTEVYMRAIARALADGRQALVLVPEIALTPALERSFRERFPGARIMVQTSAAPEAERANAWLQAQAGRAEIVLGTRLAVFCPLPQLGIIVVDEEQDASLKQQEGLRYSARDVAVVRARDGGVPVVLSSATPSLETWQNARTGRYLVHALSVRAHTGATLPVTRLVDTRQHPLVDGISAPLAEAITARLARGEQSLVFLNRRGYAPVLACGACGWVSGCIRCSAHLVVHLSDRELRCHHCGHVAAVPRHCPSCGNVDLQPFGRGTQRVEESLAARFPDASILRVDSDSARGSRGKINALIADAGSGRADILVGTQILAKGHHFERVTLVGVLNADSGLFAADYRASERLFAQLQQVSGRSGRASLKGEVLIQTRYPAHPLYQALVRNDYAGFADTLLAERETAGFPPYVHEAVLRAESREPEDALGFLARAIAAAPVPREDITLYDPAPMSLARLSGWERAQVVAQSASRRAMQLFLTEWNETLATMPDKRVRWHFDVDPIEY